MGYCEKPPALVYEIMDNGILFHHLYSKVGLLHCNGVYIALTKVYLYRMCVLLPGRNEARSGKMPVGD